MMLSPANPLMTDASDDELLRRYVRGADRSALTELIRRYAGMVYAAAVRQTHDPNLAEDVTQCVFIALARSAASIWSGAAIGPWLFKTTRYTALGRIKEDALRFRGSQKRIASSLILPNVFLRKVLDTVFPFNGPALTSAPTGREFSAQPLLILG